MSPNTPLLTVRDLSTRFATPRGELLAVDGVSLTLERGETLGVVGESGSGKSVLVRSVMSILPRSARVSPTSQVLLDGRDVRSLSPTAARHFFGVEVAMVFQDPMTSLNPVKKIGVQLTEPIRYHLGMSRADARRKALELLEQVGIGDAARRLDRYPHELSGGMRQRVVIAIALSCSPKLLIADEPTTALDVTVQKQILDLLQSIQHDTGMGMIMITHDLGVVAGRTDRIAVMYGARLVETSTSRTLFAEPRHPYTTALMRSIPRVELPSHTPLESIPGQPPDMVAPPPACRFAPRCPRAQPMCQEVDPGYVVPDGPAHQFCCHFPVGTEPGEDALRRNLDAGVTAAGLRFDLEVVS